MRTELACHSSTNALRAAGHHCNPATQIDTVIVGNRRSSVLEKTGQYRIAASILAAYHLRTLDEATRLRKRANRGSDDPMATTGLKTVTVLLFRGTCDSRISVRLDPVRTPLFALRHEVLDYRAHVRLQ
jgi:hypothetical protein